MQLSISVPWWPDRNWWCRTCHLPQRRGLRHIYRINDAPPVQLAAGAPSFGTGAAFTGDVARLLQSSPKRAKSLSVSPPGPVRPKKGIFCSAG